MNAPAHGGYPGDVLERRPVLELTIRGRDYAPAVATELNDWLAKRRHGATTVVLAIETRDGTRRITFGRRVAGVDEDDLRAFVAEFRK